MKRLGPTFGDELRAAGLWGRLNWSGDGDLWFAPDATDAEKAAVQAVVDAHDPTKLASPPVPPVISDRQFAQGLSKVPYSLVTAAEALAFVSTGTIPATLEGDILALPVDQQADARIVVAGATEFRRDHALMAHFQARRGWTSAQMDEFFRFCASL